MAGPGLGLGPGPALARPWLGPGLAQLYIGANIKLNIFACTSGEFPGFLYWFNSIEGGMGVKKTRGFLHWWSLDCGVVGEWAMAVKYSAAETAPMKNFLGIFYTRTTLTGVHWCTFVLGLYPLVQQKTQVRKRAPVPKKCMDAERPP